MKLIIAEKAIAGERIANILSRKPKKKTIKGIPVFQLTFKNREFLLIPLKGHIQDVDFSPEYKSWQKVDLKKLVDGKIVYINNAKDIVSVLKENSDKVGEVVIATDYDREGEAIGLEALRIIKEKNPKIKVSRAYFSAITEEEILGAFSKLGSLDINLAESANARREIDLIWGAVLSRFLSLTAKRMGSKYLSAGRVQTPTLALVVEREKERQKFKAKKYYQLEALLEKNKTRFKAFHEKTKFDKKSDVEKAKKNSTCKHGRVLEIRVSERRVKKPIPFNTTQYIRAASVLGYSAAKAMFIAERLYMSGFISYPRTDNQTYPKSLDLAKTVKMLSGMFKEAKQLLKKEKLFPSYGKKSADHPPIYPVSLPDLKKLSRDEKKIYELVARRFLATLSEEAVLLSTSVVILLNKEKFIARGLNVKKKGWKAFYPYASTEETTLPMMKEGDSANLKKLVILEKETQPPGRYSQGSLIKLMEDLGLGTKATRHETIQKLIYRNFLVGSGSLEPTPIAMEVISTLEKYSPVITKPKMTSELEKETDLVALGKKKKKEVIKDSKEMLLLALDSLLKNEQKIAKDLREGIRKSKFLGKCPKCKKGDLRVLRNKRGNRFIACNRYPDCKTTFPLPQKGLLQFTDKLCNVCNHPVVRIMWKGRRGFTMCINPDCKTKDKWKAKIKARQEKESKESKEEKRK